MDNVTYVAVACSHCQNWSRVDEAALAHRVRCPNCAEVFLAALPERDEIESSTPAPASSPTPAPAPSPALEQPAPQPENEESAQTDKRKRAGPRRRAPIREKAPIPKGMLALAFSALGIPVFALIGHWLGQLSLLLALVVALPLGLLATVAALHVARRREPVTHNAVAACAMIFTGYLFVAILMFIVPHDPGAGAGASSEEVAWRELSPPEAECAVQMPGEPKRREIGAVDGLIRGATYRTSVKSKDLDVTFTVLDFSKHADASIRRLIESEERALDILAIHRVVTGAIWVNGFKGRELVVDAGREDDSIVEQIFVIDQRKFYRVYVLAVKGPGVSPDNEDTRRFLDSFRIHLKPVQLQAPDASRMPGLIANWTLDKPNAGGPLIDRSTHRLHAEADDVDWEKGVRGECARFGGRGHVRIPASDHLDFADGAPFTVTAWFKTTRHAGTLVHWTGRRSQIKILIRNNSVQATVRDSKNNGGNGHTVGSTGEVNDGQWHHVALTRDGAGFLTLFVDATIQTQPEDEFGFQDPGRIETTRGAIRTTNRFLGKSNLVRGKPDDVLDGSLDEVCVFSRTLDDREIERLAGRGD